MSNQKVVSHGQSACSTRNPLIGPLAPFGLDPLSGLQSGHQILIVQWQHGIRRVVWPPEQAERPLLLPLTK